MTAPTLRIHDGTQTRTVSGRMAALFRRLLKHEAEITRYQRGGGTFEYVGDRVFLKLQITVEEGDSVG